MALIIVRRGDRERFRFLQDTYHSLSSVRVIWDRRRQERRRQTASVAADRRCGERRATQPSTWERMGFIYLEEPR